ncbi:uncharacterized protein [Misgurnus anguillicaudatus]|uniref:uncharacterized protein n=1 Tax=Misgurnus anguillicaudatus TaxID=75329 RepID=UPI003CCFAF43
MDGKLSKENIRDLLAPWRFTLMNPGIEERLLLAMQLFERFPLDITVTGGTHEANAQLCSVVCGLDQNQKMEEENEENEESEEDDEEDDDDDDEEDNGDEEEEDANANDEDAKRQDSKKKRVRIAEKAEYMGWGVSYFDSMVSHSQIPNVRVKTVHGHPISNCVINTKSQLYDSTNFDVLVALTTEERREDHTWLRIELRDRNKPFYLVKAQQVWDVVDEKPSGPCLTCAWERMRARKLELQKREKETFGETLKLKDQNQSPSDAVKLVEMKDIGEVFAKALPDLQKTAFSQFLVAITKELWTPKFITADPQIVVSTALKYGKINKDDLDKISRLSHPRDVTDDPSKLLAILRALDDFRLDIGVLGETGCGSSSLINALLGKKNDEEQSAPTGATETTEVATKYLCPELSNIYLVDLPGFGKIGGLNGQSLASSYSEAQVAPSALALCDVYILLSPLRLKLGIVQLLQQLSSRKKECYLVITMADLIEEKFIVQVREWAEGVLKELGLKQNLFLVSAHHPETLDFPKLKETIHKAIPNQKKVALARYAAKLLDEDVFWSRSDSCKSM